MTEEEWSTMSREQKIESLLRGYYEALDMKIPDEHKDGIAKGRSAIWATPFGRGEGKPSYGLCIVGNSYEEAIFAQLRGLQEATRELLELGQ